MLKIDGHDDAIIGPAMVWTEDGNLRDVLVYDEEAKTYFRMKDLEAHLVRNNFKGMTHPKMAQRLRDLGGEPISLFLKNRAARCWRIPRFNRQDAPFETPEQRTQRSPF